MDPIKLEFIVKGDIDKELAKIKLAIKGVGDESYTSFRRLLNSSNDAFNGLSRVAQGQAVILQQVIQELRQNEAAQEALFEKFEKGTVSATNYAQAQARLSVQQAELKRQASELNQELQREIQLNGKVADSLEQKISHLSSLKVEYSKLTREERDNEHIGGKIIEKVKVLNNEIEEINNRFRTEKSIVSQVSGSLQEKTTILSKLCEEYSRLNKEERENEKIGGQLITRIRELNREIKSINDGMKDTKTESGDLTDALEMIPGAIGGGVSKFKQLLSAGKAFMSSGIGMFVGGLASAFFVLKTGIEGSEEATTKLAAKTEYFKSIYSTQKKMLTEGIAAFWNLITGNTDAMNENLKAFTRLQLHQVGYAQLAEKAVVEQNKVNKLEERNNGLILANASAIEQYRNGLMDVNKTFEERKKLGQDILKLEKDNSQLKLDVISEKYKVFIDRSSEGFERITGQFPEQTKLAQEYFKTLTTGGELTLTQQHNLINAINDITSGLDKSWNDEQKAEFRSYFTDALAATKDYYNKSREVSTSLSNIIKQQANEVAKANKKTALEKLQEEVKLYKEQYAILYAYERNMGKEAADEAFKDLKTKGSDFIAYLSNKINELQNKPNRTKADDINLGYLQKTRQEAAPKFDASAFKHSIEEKKKLYKEDLDGYIAYLEKLRKLMNQATGAAGTQKRIILDLEIVDQKEEQQKQLNDLVKNYQTYTLKMTSLEKSYQQDMARLTKGYQTAATEADKKRYGEAMDARTNAYQLELAGMTAENAEFTRVLFGDMEEISRSALKKAIDEAKKFVAEWKKNFGTVTPEIQAFLDRFDQAIRSAEDEDSSRLPENMRAVATALQDCANMADAFDDALCDVLQNAADLANTAASIATGIAQISSGNVVQGISGIVSGVAGFITGIGKRLQENKKVRQEYLQSLVDTYSKELEYNAILRERLRLQQQIGETTLEYSARLEKELKLQQSSIDREYRQVWNKLMGENYISGQGYKHGTWFRKAKTWNEYSSLAGKSYEDIESLYTQDKLDGAAKTLFERLKALKEEGADVVDMMDQLNEEMKESWTGTTSSAISDSIMQGFLDGKRSAVDFADDFKGLMRQAMMQSIQMKYLEAPLQKWYEKFAQDSETGLTSDKIEELRKAYDQIIESATKEAENLEKITGIGMATGEAERTATAKGIQAMSQDSANELNGRFYALQYITANIDKNVTDIQFQLYKAAERWIMIEENTRYCRKLEEIEKYMKEMKNGISTMVNNGVLMRKQQ